MIRDMMIECVERRFGGSRAPHKVQWLTDNGSIFAADRAMRFEQCCMQHAEMVELPRQGRRPTPHGALLLFHISVLIFHSVPVFLQSTTYLLSISLSG
jgi:hypothetical protein